MRLALISDIHANLAALEAVLADLPPVDRVVCCGDLVEYYDQPNEVCALMRSRDIPAIRGNHDAYVIGALTPTDANRAAYRTDWTRDVLDETHRRWLEGLPTDMQVEDHGRRLSIRHASPWDEETYLYADADAALARLRIADGEILAVGHTHRPLHIRAGEGWLLNPGSVGQPRDYDPRASYAILDLETNAVEHRRVEYDVAAVQYRLRGRGWPDATVAILSRTA
jgi:putative phosphoesterase